VGERSWARRPNRIFGGVFPVKLASQWLDAGNAEGGMEEKNEGRGGFSVLVTNRRHARHLPHEFRGKHQSYARTGTNKEKTMLMRVRTSTGRPGRVG